MKGKAKISELGLQRTSQFFTLSVKLLGLTINGDIKWNLQVSRPTLGR